MAPTILTRVFALAKGLNVEPKDLLELGRRLGMDVKNQLSTLTPSQCKQLVEAVRGGSIEVSKAIPLPTPKPVVLPKPLDRPRIARPKLSVPPQREDIKAAVFLKPQLQYSPAKNPGIERLLSIGEKAGFEKLEKIASVAQIDPECAMFKIRKLTERLCRGLLKPNLREDLYDAIKEIESRKLLGKKVISYLHQVRKLSNVAVHVSDDLFDDEFSMNDVNNAAEALASVIEEALARNLIAGK